MRQIKFAIITLLIQLLLLTFAMTTVQADLTTSITTKLEALNWQDTGKTNPHMLTGCFTSPQPNQLIFSGIDLGGFAVNSATYIYNWETGQTKLIDGGIINSCGQNNGLMYGHTSPAAYYRIANDNFTKTTIAHFPFVQAMDGSLRVYSIEGNKLWLSDDGGLTWQQRGQSLFTNAINLNVAASPLNSNDIYVFVQFKLPGSNNSYTSTIYFSPDGGQTFEERHKLPNGEGGVVVSINGNSASVDTVELVTTRIDSNNRPQEVANLSIDGARTFTPIGINQVIRNSQLYQTRDGIIRFSSDPSTIYALSITKDGGSTWQQLPFPFIPAKNAPEQIVQSPVNTQVFFAFGNGKQWYSSDDCQSWQELAKPNGVTNAIGLVPPYAPTILLDYNLDDGHVYKLDLSASLDVSITAYANVNNAPGGTYFKQTGHNLSGIFQDYWQQHGGLAQFGYPKTEPLREVNPADGKIYTVQYFERNRFEYHPENTGTQYEVELGLLGNQLTSLRRMAGEAPFKPTNDVHQPGNNYYSQTGHNLQGVFKNYWEQHGGLAIYGFPISEEFQEVNPDDGKIYTVQYFERNRFEYHPEYKGTNSEVLLGLLGNSLLKQKRWL